MESPLRPLKLDLLQELLLLKRDAAVAQLNAVFDGQRKELCLRTLFPKQIPGVVSACLARRGELETGAGARCFFVGDRSTWESLCNAEQPTNQILIAEPKLGFYSAREELLPLARARGHAVIYSHGNPRPDLADVVILNEPKEQEVLEVLKKNKVPAKEAERLARQSNGNIYLLTRLLTGTSAHAAWAADDAGYQVRCLALLGGWDESSAMDRQAVADIVGEPYEGWAQRIYLLAKRDEPPVLLDGKVFKPVARYETWQQLTPFLTDADLARFHTTALKVLLQTAPELDLPKEERHLAGFRELSKTHSTRLREGVAETLALLGAKGSLLPTSPNLARDIAAHTVSELLSGADWKRWATLQGVATKLAEAAPSSFISALERDLLKPEQSAMKDVFTPSSDLLFGRNYHVGILWALEMLAWSGDHLNRVATILTRLAQFPLPQNMGNNALATLRGIFLPWLPQTLASVEARKAAVQCVVSEDAAIGWKLLLDILPESHQVGHYNQKPHWRDDWFPEEWSEGVTRSELYRQVRNYSELAVQLAMTDRDKMIEVIARWDHLPIEVFQQILDYLESAAAKSRPDADRFALWQKLADEVDRHRKYKDADWAMPDEELQRLENAAQAIKPGDPAIIHQRLFNDYDHHFFTGDDYEAEAKKVAQMRTDAVAEILARNGAGYFLEMARVVKRPEELGSALGRLGQASLDQLVLPGLLEAEKPLADLMAGYVWARYCAATITWAKSVDVKPWTAAQTGTFFARLPFNKELWELAESRLGGARAEYWSRLWPNPYQARENLKEAAEKALQNGRPELAVACFNSMHHLKESIPTALATEAVKQLLKRPEAVRRVDRHDLLEVIKALQEAPDANEADVSAIELNCLPALDRFSGGRPVFLERQLANDPAFFHEVITICFRSEQQAEKDIEPDPDKKARAELIFPLLHNWNTPPGTTKEQKLDETAFAKWFAEVRNRCEASGHWAIAQQMIGKTLIFPPAGLEQMLNLPVVAKTADARENEHVRRGLRMELFNSRGVHGFSRGKDELKLAASFRERADQYDLATYPQIAGTLRSLAESYERDAERDAKRDPYSD
jgi:hypothetical protein